MKSANVVARVQPRLKEKAESIILDLGLPVSLAINALYHQIIFMNDIPFKMSLADEIPNTNVMTQDEFEEMILDRIKEVENGEVIPYEEVIDSILKDIDDGKI